MNKNSNLYLALKDIVVDPESEYMSELTDSTYEFSRNYRNNVKRLYGKQSLSSHGYLKMYFRLALVIITAIVIMIPVTGNTPARRTNEFEYGIFIEEDYKYGFSNYTFVRRKDGNPVDLTNEELHSMFVYSLPTYIPNGYYESYKNVGRDYNEVGWQNGDKSLIFYNLTIDQNFNFDNFESRREKVKINNCDGYYMVSTQPEGSCACQVVWSVGGTCYALLSFDPNCNIMSKDEIIRVAESVRPYYLKNYNYFNNTSIF